jgi:hypothetical protein
MKPETISQAVQQESGRDTDVAPVLRKPYHAPALRPLGTFRARTLSGGSGAPDTNQTHLGPG